MHVVVCIKQVPDTAEVRLDPERGTLIRQGVPGILNPLDTHAVEAAVALCEAAGGNVTALSMGPPAAEEALREALALGADRALLLTDRAFAGADTWATSYTLSLAVRALGDVGLVVCGKQAIDGDTAQVGPGLATHLGWPQVTYVSRVVGLRDGGLLLERLTDYGTERVRVQLPALLTALKDLNVPRLPSLARRMGARRAEVERWGPDRLEGDPGGYGLEGSLTRVVRVFTPPPRGECKMLTGEPAEAACELADVLRERKLL